MESKKQISFDVEGKPPKKSQWGTSDAILVIKLREAALKSRNDAYLFPCYHGPIKLNLTVYAPNITYMKYKQYGDDDPNKFIGDLDSLVSGVCEYLQPAPKDITFEPSPLFNGKNEIGPDIPLIIKNDSQIVEVCAKKMHDDFLHYHVEIEFIGFSHVP